MARRRAPAVALGLAAVLLSIGLSASKHVIVDGPEAASGGPGVDCTSACTFAVRAVCGADGEWYQNDCLAACSGGVAPGDAKLCEGEASGGNAPSAEEGGSRARACLRLAIHIPARLSAVRPTALLAAQARPRRGACMLPACP